MVLLRSLLMGLTAMASLVSGLPSTTQTSDLGPAKRGPSNARPLLMWSPQGRIFYMVGVKFPEAVINGFYSMGEGGPAKALFNEWSSQANDFIHFTWYDGTFGGVYGKGGDPLTEGKIGFAVQCAEGSTNQEMQNVVKDILNWAQRVENVGVKVLQVANDYFDLGTIGAGESGASKRSRSNTCPAKQSLMQYADGEVRADIDINKNVRFAGTCDES
ncbi:hypothetical protein SCAR479_00447 [Seiridium cardinale]|uniref:Uncharacterized protein n=1 Tax=Seiridium cardinale TaxID=138064 RepID=A0ABR2Y9J0_9PEZI